MNGFNFSMTPEEIIEKCGKPTETDNEENGYLCYRYKGTKSEFLFGFENGVMHEMAFSVSID